jgi:hypothetical protein
MHNTLLDRNNLPPHFTSIDEREGRKPVARQGLHCYTLCFSTLAILMAGLVAYLMEEAMRLTPRVASSLALTIVSASAGDV